MTGNARAAALMVLAMACFACEDALLKLLSQDLPAGQLLLCVGFAGMALSGIWVGLRQGLNPRDLLYPGVALRNLSEAICGVAFVTALSIGDLSIVSAILQALPLLMTLGAALFMGEQVGPRRWFSICVGFIGVLLIVRPGTEAFQPGSVLAVIAVLALAVRDLVTRKLPAGIGSGILTVSAFGSMGLAGALLIVMGSQQMHMPTLAGFGGIAGCVVFGLMGYVTMVTATRIGQISAIAPFRYSRLIFAILLGMIIFAERPDRLTLLGSTLIAAAGIYTMWREARLRRRIAATASEGPLPPV